MPAKLPNPILMASRKGQADLVLAILAHRLAPRIDLNERDDEGATSLGRLLQLISEPETTAAAVAALLAAGASPESIEPDFDERGHYDRGRQAYVYKMASLALIATRHSLHSPWKTIFEALGAAKLRALAQTEPLLQTALLQENQELVEALVAAGADVNLAQPGSALPIICCSTPASFALLVSAGAKLGVPDQNGKTALQLISSSQASSEILSMAAIAAQAEVAGKIAVFKQGAELSGPKKAGDQIAQPLIEALFESIDAQKLPRVKELWNKLGLGRDKKRFFGARDSTGRTLLHAAIEARNFTLAGRLIERGMDVNAFDAAGRTPASILIGLEHTSHERDRHGNRRERFCSKVMQSLDFTARSPKGLSYLDVLYATEFQSQNSLSTSALLPKFLAGAGDWLALDPAGETCLLSRCIATAVAQDYVSPQSLCYAQDVHERTRLRSVLAEQMERPEFTAAHAEMALRAACCSPHRSLSNPSRMTRALHADLLGMLPRFQRMGVDPEAIEWSPLLASGAPLLHAAIETWRLESTAREAPGPRARARSL